MSKRNVSPAVSRRAFVKAAASIAAAGPLLRPAGVFAGVPAAKPLGVGFIGMGKQMRGHLEANLGMRGARVIAVCDVHEGRREHFRTYVDEQHAELERKGVSPCAAFVDHRELLKRDDIDAVYIATPDHWHAAIAIDAVKAGKDVYCEKPLTLTIGEAKSLVDAVRKHNRVFQTGSQQRSSDSFRKACDYVRNGRIGKVREVHVALVGPTSVPCDLPGGSTPAGVEWERWLGPTPQRGYNEVLCRQPSTPEKYPYYPGWRSFREFSGGYVTDFGAHHIDIINWALDMDQSGPSEVLPPASPGDVYGASLIYRGSPVGDGDIKVTHVQNVYEYDGFDRKGKPERRNDTTGILFIGEKGKLFVNRRAILSEPDTILKEPLASSDKLLPDSGGHRENWMKCITTRERPVCDVEIGARSVVCCHLLNLSYWNHAKLEWDPKTWQFTGANADKANREWRDRPRREGYELPIA